MTDLKSTKPTKLLWVDLEMTGLEASHDVILEVAAIITDFDFKELASYEATVYQDDAKLANMNDWSAQHHRDSGLIDRLKTEGKSENDVDSELATLVKWHFKDEPVILAGNSIHKDRQFIQRYLPAVEELLHYRMLDVSSYKVLMQGKYGIEYTKNELHRAQSDIGESIAELEYYLDWLKTNQ